MATTVVNLRLAAVKERRHRTAGEEERVHPPQVWGPLLSDGLVYRSFDKTDLQGLARAHSSYNTLQVSQPCISLSSSQHTCAAS